MWRHVLWDGSGVDSEITVVEVVGVVMEAMVEIVGLCWCWCWWQ